MMYGLLLHFMGRSTRVVFHRSVGVKLHLRLTGWIGVPVHELGHALFCLLFRHKITEMKLYIPNPQGDTLGYVRHEWNAKSRYQNIGRFFIAIGPMLLGMMALWFLSRFMVRDFREMFSGAWLQNELMARDLREGELLGFLTAYFASLRDMLRAVALSDRLGDGWFWVFLYLSISVASFMGLSPTDIKNARSGLVFIALAVLGLNLLSAVLRATGLTGSSGPEGGPWRFLDIHCYEPALHGLMGVIGGLLMYAIVISALYFAGAYLLLSVYNLARGRGFIRPF